MIRFVWLTILGAAVLSAQQKPAETLVALQETAQQKTAEWETLGADLESRIAHLLPCDPRVRSAIDEVSRASEARLTALSRYFEAKRAKAKLDGDTLSVIMATQEALAAAMKTEGAEAAQQRAAIDAQLADLQESAKVFLGLGTAQSTLEDIATSSRKRATRIEDEARKSAATPDLLRDLSKSLQERQTALDKELTALVVATTRWRDYYAARLARSQTECTVINGGRKKP
jgi:hypothetical protein